MKTKTEFITLLIAFCIIPFIVMYSAFSYGYVATIFYDLFILPVFPQFIKLTTLHFMGIYIFISCFAYSSSFIKTEYTDTSIKWISIIFRPWYLLFIAWIIKLIVF